MRSARCTDFVDCLERLLLLPIGLPLLNLGLNLIRFGQALFAGAAAKSTKAVGRFDLFRIVPPSLRHREPITLLLGHCGCYDNAGQHKDKMRISTPTILDLPASCFISACALAWACCQVG
jgi:hypothetical protein